MDKLKKPRASAALYQKLFTQDLSKGQKARLKIAEGAIEALATGGLNNFSFDVLAKRLRTTRSHIAYYFKSNDELMQFVFKLVIETAQRHTVEALRSHDKAWGLLDAMSEGACSWLFSHPSQAKCWLSLFEQACRDSIFLELNDQIRAGGLARLDEIIRQLRPQMRSAESRALARAVQCLITGELIHHLTTRSKAQKKDLVPHLKKMARALVASF